MVAELDTDLWLQQNVARSHVIAMFLQQSGSLRFALGSWPPLHLLRYRLVAVPSFVPLLHRHTT